MANVTEEYQKLVLDDLNRNAGLYHIVPAGFFERNSIKKIPLSKIHPNPEDEFSDPEIGPNYQIVSDYAKEFRSAIEFEKPKIMDPLVVEKLSTGDYMLLNGHHRWMAANRLKLQKVPVEIVNPVSIEEIMKTLEKSDRSRCMSFDLDEVLLEADGNLRSGAAALIGELHVLGFDVWIYTGQYVPEKKINKIFKKQGTSVEGIINCYKKKTKSSDGKISDFFKSKYELLSHVDNDLLVLVNTKTKDAVTEDIITERDNWASTVISLLKEKYEQ